MKIDKVKLKSKIPIDEYYQDQLGAPAKTYQNHMVYFCPFHNDEKTPNLAVYFDGSYKCFACDASGGDVFAFHQKRHNLSFPQALNELADKYAPELIQHNSNGNGRTQEIVAEYDYRDESGELLFQTVRYKPKDFKYRKPDGNGDWIWNLQGVRRVPYRLPELIASEGEIYVCEGEKDVDRLVDLGLTATTCPMGAGKWRHEYSEWLKDRDVVIIPDNDPVGREHAGKIACALHGLAKSIKIVSLPGLSEHGDVFDYLDQHTKENLLIEVEKTSFYESATSILERLETWNQIGAMDIKVEWLVDRLIPKGAITVLFGQGGVGKTWLMMDAALNIGNGSPFLNLKTLKTPVIFVDFENPLVTLNTRIKKLGKAENVFFWRSGNSDCKAPKLDSKEWDQYKLLPKDSLLIFDTLRASQGGDENASDSMAVIMNKLKELRDLGMTIVVLHHTSKNQNKLAKGSTAIVDLCDHVLGLWAVKNQEDDTNVEDDEIDEETVYRFGWKDKTRFEPYEVHLTLNPDRGFELAPDPEGKSLLEMHEYLEEHGPLKKTDFAKGVNKHLRIPEKKARKLIGRGDGRYWEIEGAGANNTKMVSIIRLGSLAPPIGPAKPPNRIETLEPQLNKGIYSETI